MSVDYTGPLAETLIVVDDDNEARRIALIFELLNHLTDPPVAGARFNAQIYTAHPSHWVVCIRFFGVTLPGGNGWGAWFFPKRDFRTAESVTDAVRTLAGGSRGGL